MCVYICVCVKRKAWITLPRPLHLFCVCVCLGSWGDASVCVWRRGGWREAPSSVSSSDLSSFAGFIEDPLEQERSGDIQAWRIGLAGDTEEVKPDRSAF